MKPDGNINTKKFDGRIARMAENKKKRIAMVVPNLCNPDYRVVKQAETLAAAGYEVRVFCTWKAGTDAPLIEEFNDVTYVRREWNVIDLIKNKLFGVPLPSDTVKLKTRYVDEEK